ncbi:hypothetical protein [Geoalkalibacter halelectricus]|uniref:NERD domain-containing protein n=1 Tax=Geoalkalibacter halelectricus TaxID=2847045 RepID=A0ABY5ZU51_9BACT|nr:hypothetical protein [Geoalkalibacter halelectricus]MDO3377699.1 hypothetical protein [Geoalkalibacter halelectricus]UWZ81487.1 hypothetical protein L9S41_08845 [Geoalkalibacter halelectricus]
MEMTEKIKGAKTPKQKIKLIGELFDVDFDLAVRMTFSGAKKHKISPFFKDRKFLKEFWQSDLPSMYGWQIVSLTPNAPDYWGAYFRQEKVCETFVATGFENAPELMLKSLRCYGGFLRDCHWESYRPFLKALDNEQSRELLAGSEFFRDLQAKMDASLKKFTWEIKEASIAEILCAFVLLSEQVYFATSTEAAFMAKRLTLLSLLEDLLNEKYKGDKENSRKWPDQKQIHKELFLQIKALHNGQEPELFPLFREFDQRAQAKYLLQMFQWHDWVVDFSKEIPVVRPRGNAWRVAWEQTESKYRIFHDYYSGFNLEDLKSSENLAADSPNEISRDVVRRIYFGTRFLGDELGIADKISIKDAQIDLMAALVILNRFSGCYEAQYQHAMAEQKRAGVDFANAIMNALPRAPLEIRNIQQISEINRRNQIELSLEDTKLIFELGSANLDQFPTRIDGQAFLKTPAGYLLLMRYFHSDIKTVLFNAIVRQSWQGNKEYSDFQENKIAEIFRIGGWRAIDSQKLKNKEGLLSEIDVIAYKDGVLFLIEAKLTYLRSSIKEIHNHLPQLEKAGIQLERAIVALKDNYPIVCDWLEISDTFDRLRIVSLIVSSSFEYDHKFFNGFRKVSLFELQLLLQGTTPILKAWLKMKEIASEALSPELYDRVVTGHASDEDWNALRELMSKLSMEEDLDKIMNRDNMKDVLREASAEDVADAIQSGAVWRHLIPEPVLGPDKLEPLTIDGAVIANYAV